MAPPPNKKQKTDDAAAPSPIVFQSPGLQPDVRLVVFDTEFHVHSIILKLYSAFFRKFLDSPDKAAAAEAAAVNPSIISPELIMPKKFKYEWVTKLDEDAESGDDNVWYLVAATGVPKVSFCYIIQHTVLGMAPTRPRISSSAFGQPMIGMDNKFHL